MEKASTNADEVNNITLELKLAGQMSNLKAPGFALEVLSCLGAIARGQSELIWNSMKRILEDSEYLCFQLARNLDCDYCNRQDSRGRHQDMSKKLFCTAAGLQKLDFSNTYTIARSKADDQDNLFHLVHIMETVTELSKFLPKMMDLENMRGNQAKSETYANIFNGYGLSAMDRYKSVD